MPEFSIDALNRDEEVPLFPPSDPLQFTLPDPDTGAAVVFTCIDNPLLPDDRVNNLRSSPRAYLVSTLAGWVEEGADRRRCEKIAHQLFDEQLIDIDKAMELMDWLNEQREAAKKRRAKAVLRRPTGGQSPSLPS